MFIKKSYSTPQLLIHGDVAEITLAGCSPNSDRPTGTTTDSDAYPCASP